MNLASRRIFLNLKRLRSPSINQFGHIEAACLLLSRVDNVQTRPKSKYARSDLFGVQDNDRHEEQDDETIGIYGYSLLGIPIITFILGTWQVQRRQWKLGLIEDLQTRTTSEPIELPENLEDLGAKEFCPVHVKGTFLHDKEFTIGPKTLVLDGTATTEHQGGLIGSGSSYRGYWIITPFKLADRDLTILVNRGWVPEKLKKPASRKYSQTEGVVDLVGLVRLNETRPPFMPKNLPESSMWHYRDLHAMAEHAGTAPVYIDQVADKNKSSYPIGGQTRVTLRNEHLTYIITWYSLSASTGYMWYRYFIQKLPLL